METNYDKLVWEIEAKAHEIRFNHLKTVEYMVQNGGDIQAEVAKYRAALDNMTAAVSVVKDFQYGTRFLAMAGKDMDEEIMGLLGAAPPKEDDEQQ